MRRKTLDPFVLIVTDRDTRTFSVEGPMIDDSRWSEPVVAAQKEGRQVNCHSVTVISDRQVAARQYKAAYPDMQEVPPGSIVHP